MINCKSYLYLKGPNWCLAISHHFKWTMQANYSHILRCCKQCQQLIFLILYILILMPWIIKISKHTIWATRIYIWSSILCQLPWCKPSNMTSLSLSKLCYWTWSWEEFHVFISHKHTPLPKPWIAALILRSFINIHKHQEFYQRGPICKSVSLKTF